LTSDYAAAELFVRSANISQAPTQGTAISEAIDLAERSFEQDNKHHKALIIISDGENHDKDAIERAKEANENGLLIFTVGVGTTEGAYIPTVYAGQRGVKRDQTGNPIRSLLNEAMLGDLAKEGDGAYYNLLEGDKVVAVLQERIDKIEKREMEQRSFNEYESYFQYFLAVGLLLMLLEFFVSYRKSKWLEGKDLFKT
jgi:Ca-activated chloride channel family protein